MNRRPPPPPPPGAPSTKAKPAFISTSSKPRPPPPAPPMGQPGRGMGVQISTINGRVITSNHSSYPPNMNMLGKRGPPNQIYRPGMSQMPFSSMQMPMSSGKTKNTMSSLESKVANAPKKKNKNKPTFILGNVNKKNLMEDYLE